MTGDLEELITAAATRGAIEGTRHALAASAVDGTGPLLYSPKAAGEVLGCSERRVRELMDAGDLVPVAGGPGRGRQIARSTLVAYVDRLVAAAVRDLPLRSAS